jgi:HlyD family secretion protein
VSNKRVTVLLAVALAVVALTGCTSGGVDVATAQVARGDIRMTVSVSGNIDARDDRVLSFGMPGKVAAVPVEKGDTVQEGAVLGRLDTDDLERNVEQALNGLEAARIQYEIADQQLRQTIYPHYYFSYVVDVPGVWMSLDNATTDLEDARSEIESGDVAVANRLLDSALKEISDAKESAQSRRWELPAAVKIMELQREVAETQIESARLGVEAAQSALDDAIITAPFSGVVTMVNVKEDEDLSAASFAKPAFRIIDPSTLEMTGMIDEIDIADVRLGQEAIITLDALPDMEVSGTVTYISQAATIEAGVVLYETTITLQNPPESVKDGMSATADLVLKEHTNVLVVPAQAIMRGANGQDIVYLVQDGKLVSRDVQVGFRSGRMAEITSGLSDGDTVSLEPPQ